MTSRNPFMSLVPTRHVSGARARVSSQRDLFENKLKKKSMVCWRNEPELVEADKDYDKNLAYIKKQFLAKNKSEEDRQVRCPLGHSSIPHVAHHAVSSRIGSVFPHWNVTLEASCGIPPRLAYPPPHKGRCCLRCAFLHPTDPVSVERCCF